MIDPKRFLSSFRHALRGVRLVFRTEHSFRLQVVIALGVLVLSAVLGISKLEWVLVLLLIAAVLGLELINSVLERIVDAFKPRVHPVVRDIKDLMAGVVLIMSVVAGIVGLMIFLPYLVQWF